MQPHAQPLPKGVKGLAVAGSVVAYRWVDSTGSGQPTVILGGTFANVFSFQHLERELSTLGPVMLVDLPGSGFGGVPAPGFTHAAAVDTFVEFMDLQQMPAVNLIGISAGGPVAHAYAALYPERVRALVLGSAVLWPKPRDIQHLTAICRHLDERDTQAMSKAALDFLMDDPGGARVVRGAATRALITSVLRETPDERMKGMAISLRGSLAEWEGRPSSVSGVKALVYTGEHDPYADVSSTIGLAGSVESSVMYVMSGTDHMIHIERPRELAGLICGFLSGKLPDDIDYAYRFSDRENPRRAELQDPMRGAV